jgi:hypothetical protein
MPQFGDSAGGDPRVRNRPTARRLLGGEVRMSDDRDLADTYFVRRAVQQQQQQGHLGSFSYPDNKKMSLPNGRTVQPISREVFEEAVRAATLKE